MCYTHVPEFLQCASSGSLEMLHQLEVGYIVTHVTVDWENSDIFYVAKSASNSRVRHVLWVESNLLFNKTEQAYKGYHSN